jgi:hypothetical protein
VGTATTAEVSVLRATNDGTDTNVSIGEAGGNRIDVSSATGTTVTGAAKVDGSFNVDSNGVAAGGSALQVNDSFVQAVSADGESSWMTVMDSRATIGHLDTGTGLDSGVLAMDGTFFSGVQQLADSDLDGTYDTLVSQHGLMVDGTQTVLTGGTNSSSLTLADAAATLAVGTATDPEVSLLRATNDGTDTNVSIGEVGGNTIDVNSATGTMVTGALSVDADGAGGGGLNVQDVSANLMVDAGSNILYGISADANTGVMVGFNDVTDPMNPVVGGLLVDTTETSLIGAGNTLSLDSNGLYGYTAMTSNGMGEFGVSDSGVGMGYITPDGITTFGLAAGNAAALGLPSDGVMVGYITDDGVNPVVQHGLVVTAAQTTLTGGTNSSSLTLADATATLAVGTATDPEVSLLRATNDGTDTNVSIGEVGGNTIDVNSATGTMVTGAMAVTGAATLNGATTVNNTFNVDSNNTLTPGGNTFAVDSNGIYGVSDAVNTGSAGGAFGASDLGAAIGYTDGDFITGSGYGLVASSSEVQVGRLDSGVFHGLSVDATETLLTGGTNSSSLSLVDAAATLAVGTATSDETNAIVVSGTDADGAGAGVLTNTTVTIGGASNTQNNLLATATGGINNITANATDGVNNISAATNNITGATNINTTGTAATTIGSAGNTSAVSIYSGSNSVVVNNNDIVLANATSGNTFMVNEDGVYGYGGTLDLMGGTGAGGAFGAAAFGAGLGFIDTTTGVASGLVAGDPSLAPGVLPDLVVGRVDLNNDGSFNGLAVDAVKTVIGGGDLNDDSVTGTFATLDAAGILVADQGGTSHLVSNVSGQASLGYAASASDTETTAVGAWSEANGNGSSAFGYDAYAEGYHSTALGSNAEATSGRATAVGYNARAYGEYSSAMGNWSEADGQHATAIGSNSDASADYSTAVGGYAYAGYEDTAVGYSAGMGASGDQGVSVGAYSYVGAPGGVAVGYQARVEDTAPNSVALGQNSVARQADTVSVGDEEAGLTRRVTNVAPGVDGTDAVNVDQLEGMMEKAYQGIAAVAALSSIPEPMPGKNYSIGVGVGHYEGENAVALGFKANVTEEIRFSAAVGINDNKPVTAVGMGISF